MLVKKNIDIILASKSPRRQELLQQIDVCYRCMPSNKEEVITTDHPGEAVKELSAQKARDIEEQVRLQRKQSSRDAQSFHTAQMQAQKNQCPIIIIGADTVVAFEGKILGKPKDGEEAYLMLSMLSGKSHEVYTGVTVIYLSGYEKYPRKEIVFSECTKVKVADLSEEDIRNYIATNEPMDKAGAYGIQGKFGKYVTGIEGDYNNVVGLPVARLFQEVRDQLGINLSDAVIEKRKKVQACIFDLDGTTLDTLESIGSTVNLVLKEFGLKTHEIEEYKQFAGDGQFELMKRSLKASGDEELKNYDAAMKRYIELFKDRCTYHVKLYDGIRELMDSLKEKGIRIAILSNKHHENVISILDGLFGQNYFDCALGQREDHKKKPSGEGIDIILNEIRVHPENCIYAGDTNTDMLTGKAYGLYTVGVTWGFRDKEELISADADFIVDRPEEILSICR